MNMLRYWEIDTLRGLALVLMVYYHLMWDLAYFDVIQLDVTTGFWKWFARSIGTTFIFVVGVSLAISYMRTSQKATFQKYLLRGGKILCLGLGITLGTYLIFGQGFVIFGILHLLGFAIIAAYPFLLIRQRWMILTSGLLVIGLGVYLSNQVTTYPWLIWLGVKQVGRMMIDYYPVLPWFGVALVGIFTGYTIYPNGQPRFALVDRSNTLWVSRLSFLGRHSLLIYLVHQPLLIGLLIISGIGSV